MLFKVYGPKWEYIRTVNLFSGHIPLDHSTVIRNNLPPGIGFGVHVGLLTYVRIS